ncbi:MAG: hypothetical protein CG440_682, partial [Methanosaeta sp. NSM2]
MGHIFSIERLICHKGFSGIKRSVFSNGIVTV